MKMRDIIIRSTPTATGEESPRISHIHRSLLAVLTAIANVITLTTATAQTPPPPAALPIVQSMDGKLAMGETVDLKLTGLKEWSQKGNPPTDLRLFLNGREVPGLEPFAIDLADNSLTFFIKFTENNEAFWDDLMRRPVLKRPMTVSAGVIGGYAFPTELKNANWPSFMLIRAKWAWLAILLVSGIAYLLIKLARSTSLIRDHYHGVPAHERTYSLARTQAAFWFYLIMTAYVTLWLLTGALDTITQSLLGLMGISAATMLSGSMVDSSKEAAKQIANQAASKTSDPEPTPSAPVTSLHSKGFLNDILSDSEGYSFHRFQMFAWTLVLGFIFIGSVYNRLQMPEFSATLLGLLGISSGTYVSLKFPEK